MSAIRHYFSALLSSINPSEGRRELAKKLPGEVREWLQEHAFKTSSPHTRLSGSYARNTAIQEIPDIDVLLFLPEQQRKRTPNAVLQEVKRILDDYPDASAEASPQRRSIHLAFLAHDVHLDIVPALAPGGLDEPLEVPDRPAKEWIPSDPLGYARRLSEINRENGHKVVPMIKLVKAWRDVQMKIRRPKSYVLEAMIFYAVDGDKIDFNGTGYEQLLASFFSYISDKYDSLMSTGKGVPRIPDPQIKGHFITKGWERSHFETFMRRVREAEKASSRALNSSDLAVKCTEWARIFGELWPSKEAAEEAARAEANLHQPGVARISSSGIVSGSSGAGVASQKTRFHH